jgi:fructokinase
MKNKIALSHESSATPNVVIFGEILWDVLPTGAKPGGAPMNVAYHLHKLGQRPAFISRVGKDDYGEGLLNFLQAHGLPTNRIQIDDQNKTGIVPATPNEFGEMQYEIVSPVAWDFIDSMPDNLRLVKDADFFVFGSLAARSQRTKNSLLQLLENANAKVLDVNLRPPHYSKTTVVELLGKADIIKMNEAELELIAGWFSEYTTLEERIEVVQERFKTEVLMVTLGGDGAAIHMGGKTSRTTGFKVEVADTVGAGDSFLAATICQLIQKKSPDQILEFASAVGALVASKSGGCPAYEMAEVKAMLRPASAAFV